MESGENYGSFLSSKIVLTLMIFFKIFAKKKIKEEKKKNKKYLTL